MLFLFTLCSSCAFGVSGTPLIPPISFEASQLTHDFSTKKSLDLGCRSLDAAGFPHVLLEHGTNTGKNIQMEINASHCLEDDSVIHSSVVNQPVQQSKVEHTQHLLDHVLANDAIEKLDIKVQKYTSTGEPQVTSRGNLSSLLQQIVWSLPLILALFVGTTQLTPVTTAATLETKSVKKQVAVQPAGPVFHTDNTDTSCFDPPKNTLGNDRLAYVEVLDMLTGRLSTSNPKTQVPFDSDVASGHYVLLHRPFAEGPQGDDPHVNYFDGKRRLWEIRFSCTFKKAVKIEDVMMATAPYERLPVTAAQVATQRFVMKLFRSINLYNCPGDDPSVITEGEVEKPHTSVPLTEADQYIPSVAGEAPPHLLDASFPKLGRLKAKNPSAYRSDLRQVTFQAGESHTFAFWGPSRVADLIKWKLQDIPMLKNTSMDALNGAPPIVLTTYVLNPGSEGETRHLDSRMAVLWKTAGWSTKHPPSPERLRALRAAITARGHDIRWVEDDESRRQQGAEVLSEFKGPPERSPCCLAGLRKLLG